MPGLGTAAYVKVSIRFLKASAPTAGDPGLRLLWSFSQSRCDLDTARPNIQVGHPLQS